MRKRNRLHKGFSLDIETIEAIKIKSIEEKDNDSRALDVIVREWREFEQRQKYAEQNRTFNDEELLKKVSSLCRRSFELYDEISDLRSEINTNVWETKREEAI